MAGNKNLELYEQVRSVPAEAQKKITGGRLNGKTDINPMWRIKKLTEAFGPCGKGWFIENVAYWKDEGANGETAVQVSLNLRVKYEDGWSQPIFGIGGSMLISSERNGLYTDDDAYKKAYTDALSVACKALGIGADVYWEKDPTKYESKQEGQKSAAAKQSDKPVNVSQDALKAAYNRVFSYNGQRYKLGGQSVDWLTEALKDEQWSELFEEIKVVLAYKLSKGAKNDNRNG